MKYSVDKQDRYTVFTLEEDNLNSLIAPDLKSKFVLLSNEGVENLILNLGHVEFVDSSGLSAILTANRLWKAIGSFVLTGIDQPNVKKLIEISRLDSVLTIIPTVSESIDHIIMDAIERDMESEGLSMKFEVHILGSNAAIPSHGRRPSAQIFNNDDRIYLIDCGEGTQTQMDNFGIKKSKIRQIFISHMHGDHIFGLPGLLTSYALLGRDRPLELFAPNGMEKWMNACLTYSHSHLPYKLKITTVDPSIHQLIYEDQRIEVFTIPLDHRIPACGYLFREKKQHPKIIASQIERYNIPIPEIRKIKTQDADFLDAEGNLIPNHELTLPPPLPRSFAYCTDTAYSPDIVPIVKNADLLFHEATYMESHLEQTIVSKHSTAMQAANIAKAANVKQLVIGHFSSRYKFLQPILEEAQSVFPNTHLAIEGTVFQVERHRAK